MATLQLTKNNHLKFGYDGEVSPFRKSLAQNWQVQYGRCERNPLDWHAECLIAAREIKAQTAKPIYVCLSGGLDSEVVCESFRLARISFTAAITRFKNDLNLHDIAWAIIYCETHGIAYEFMDMDIKEFYLSGEIWDYARPSRCIYPMLTPTMKLMEWVCHKGGFPVLGSAECFLQKSAGGWSATESEPIAAMFRYQIARQLEAQAGFFIWSPELILSYLLDPVVVKLTSNRIANVTSSAQIKHRIYSQSFPNLQPREKYLGLEKIRQLDAEMNKKLEAEIIVGSGVCYLDYTKLVHSLQSRNPA